MLQELQDIQHNIKNQEDPTHDTHFTGSDRVEVK